MALRFRRSFRIAPGIRLNLSKRGISTSIGGRGAHVTVGTSGYGSSLGLPGSGLSVVERRGWTSASPYPRGESSNPGTAAATGETVVHGNISQLAKLVPPREAGTRGLWAGLTNSPKKAALDSIAVAAANPGPESDASVVAAAESVPDSWTAQREAGFYFQGRGEETKALPYFIHAAELFPGEKLLYWLLAANCADNAGDHAAMRRILEPVAAIVEADDNLGALCLGQLADAQLELGNADTALETLHRLPLRRQNLSEALLYALCVRAEANADLGRHAQATKDLERVKEHNPDFPGLSDVEKRLAEKSSIPASPEKKHAAPGDGRIRIGAIANSGPGLDGVDIYAVPDGSFVLGTGQGLSSEQFQELVKRNQFAK